MQWNDINGLQLDSEPKEGEIEEDPQLESEKTLVTADSLDAEEPIEEAGGKTVHLSETEAERHFCGEFFLSFVRAWVCSSTITCKISTSSYTRI